MAPLLGTRGGRGLAAGALLLAGCTVGPDYRRPDTLVPPAFRGIGPDEAAEPGSLGDLGWWEVFEDAVLRDLIRAALAENYDLRIAMARVREAGAQLVVTRSNQLPTVDARGQAVYERTEGDRPAGALEDSFFPQAAVGLVFELDFWGRWRRATEAARADLLATEEGRHVVASTLVSFVAGGYFQLRSLDVALEIARRTLLSNQDSLRLVQLRQQGGVVTLMDVRQAESLVATAARTIPDVERQIEQTENRLNLLLGRPPGPVPRGSPLSQPGVAPRLPPGLPAALLGRRPDVRQAERQLAAATARIGEARAEFYPRVILTGTAGAGGGVQDGVSFGPLGLFGIGPVVTLPIFTAGRVQAGVDAATARTEAALAFYQQAVTQAFTEVSDALVELHKRREARVQQALLVDALRDATRLSGIRYKGGVTSYLEVLDNERQLFEEELRLTQVQRDELLAVVQLYRALGGGWQPAPAGA